MIYRQIENKSELISFCEYVKENGYGDYSFLLKDNIIVKGLFNDDEAYDDSLPSLYFVYARIIRPDEVSVPKGSIFEKLKIYGSSGRYIGLLSERGEVIIPNNYTTIDYLGQRLFRVGRDNKYGIINAEGKVVCGTIYDKVLELSEFTIGVVKNKRLGFIDCFGKMVIPMDYIYIEDNLNAFREGSVMVRKKCDNEGMIVQEFGIDHYNNIVSKIIEDDRRDYLNGYIDPCCHPVDDNDNYDILDAYEGDESNMWNTD